MGTPPPRLPPPVPSLSRPLLLLLAAAALAAPAEPATSAPAGAPVAPAAPATAATPATTAATPATAARGDAPPAVPPAPSVLEAARLAAGEVLLSSRPAGSRSLAEEVGRGIVQAPPERVFAAVTDFAHYQEWVPFVKRSDAETESDGSVVSFESLELPFPLGRRYYKFRARTSVVGSGEARVWRTWWSYLPGSGNVDDHRGWWVLVPAGAGRTLGTCSLFTDPGRGVPAWALHRGTSMTMPYIFSALRQQIHRSRYDRP
jgi:Polyketide cyclase / dehydrase and lipid transport